MDGWGGRWDINNIIVSNPLTSNTNGKPTLVHSSCIGVFGSRWKRNIQIQPNTYYTRTLSWYVNRDRLSRTRSRPPLDNIVGTREYSTERVCTYNIRCVYTVHHLGRIIPIISRRSTTIGLNPHRSLNDRYGNSIGTISELRNPVCGFLRVTYIDTNTHAYVYTDLFIIYNMYIILFIVYNYAICVCA